MRTPHKHHNDPALRAQIEKQNKKDRRLDHFFRRVLHWIERSIAVLTIIVLLICLGFEVYNMITVADYFTSSHTYLHNMLTIVVGLEFVRILIDTTPASILEVLTVALTRQVIATHDSPWASLASIACIAALFAIRRYLVRRHELKAEMVEQE